ncbi:MAG: formaldehyde-activating enzyme, partial [Methylococcaceae bacterium]
MSERIIFRTGEALLAGGPPGTAAEPEVIIGELDGPVGIALATLTGNQ